MQKLTDTRLVAITKWLRAHIDAPFTISPITGDASFRRYFRVHLGQSVPAINNASTAIVMDAPPPFERIEPFYSLCTQLFNAGVHVPTLHAADNAQGFLLLSDFGDEQMLNHLNTDSVDTLYESALVSLNHMQHATKGICVPEYDNTLLMAEMHLFTDWLLDTHLGIQLTEQEKKNIHICFNALSQSALEQPKTFVHRDYHSRNLMITLNGNLGIIDFQDAVRGPITYDAVSLLKDCYILWPENKVDEWLTTYYTLLKTHGSVDVPLTTFKQWFDLMGVQRHLKASGIFARLYHRDNKTGYLADIPNTLGYIEAVSPRYKHTRILSTVLKKYDIINAVKNKALSLCV